MTSTQITFPSADALDVVAYRWEPDGTPRGIVQITHGMGEHVQRYEPLARALTAQGFVVTGQDHRGHGRTARSDDELGQLGAAGWGHLVDDIGRLAERTRRDRPDLPHVLLGHSMGSFAAQQYALDHSDDIDALALTGTAVPSPIRPASRLCAPTFRCTSRSASTIRSVVNSRW